MGRCNIMRTTALVGTAAMVLLVTAGTLVSQENTALAGIQPADIDIEAGKTLYGDSCASCHGASLEGQPDWRSPSEDGRLPAPPHDDKGHTWHHPDSMIFAYTKLGGKEYLASQGMDFDSGMPGFGEELSDAEIWNILAFIKSTWPTRVRQIQAERTGFDNDRGEN